MAQKYNPATGQWEDDEEDTGSLSNSLSSVFGGSAPSIDGSAMTAGTPQFSNGSFSNPSYNLNSLPEGYGWGDPTGSTKKYADPWATSFDYLGADGNVLGKGYDSYEDAIRKLSFSSGAKYYDPKAIFESQASGDQGGGYQIQTGTTPGGWGFSSDYIPATSNSSEQGDSSTPEQFGQLFSTKDELYNSLLSRPNSPLAFNTTGYGIQDGVLQNIYAQYNAGAISGAVPDMVDRRVVYPGVQPAGGYNVSGDAAMVDSTPLFGPDGKVIGYKSDLNRDHTNYADTSGRQRSTTAGATNYSDDMKNIVKMIDDQYGFISASDKDKFGFNTTAQNTYSKEAGGFEKFLKMAAPIALAAFLGPQMFGPAAGAAGVGEAAALGTGISAGAGGITGATLGGGLGLTGELAGLGSMGFGGATAAGLAGTGLGAGWAGLTEGLGGIFGAGGLGLEGAPGLISDLGASFPGAFGDMAGGAVGDLASSLATNPFSGSGLGEIISSFANPNSIPGFENILSDQVASPSFSQGADALSSTSPEIMGPPQASEMEGLFLDDFGGGTNAMGEFTNGKGMLSPQDRIATSLRQLGMERETAANLTQGGSKMYNFMTQSPGKAGMFKAPSPLEMLYKGGKGIMDYRSNQDAMKMYKDQLDKVSSYSDPNRARGDTANQLWQQNFQDPMAGYQDFMMGGGRDFIDQARAQAAKSGKRGSYINSGKMNSDLASMYMKQQLARGDSLTRGFVNSPNNAENTMKYMAPMVDMERNKYAPFGQAIDSIMRGFQLSDLFGG